MSEERLSIVTFASAGFLIASIMIFSLVALPELMPTIYPQLRQGSIGIQVTSTSGQVVGPPFVSNIDITVNSIEIHRVGVGEGAWITLTDAPTQLKPMDIGDRPVSLKDSKIPIGDYNLVKLTFGEATATIRGQNVTLKGPTQELKIPVALTIAEGKRNNLILDLSFDEAALVTSQRFDPYLSVTVEQAGHGPLSTIASLKPLASLGPHTMGPSESTSTTFTVEPGAALQNYLVHAQGGYGAENTFDVEIVETGEFWYGLSGELWFLGGNLTAGTYTMKVYVSDIATADVKFAVHLYKVPGITADLPDAAFSGFVYGESSWSVQLNEFALYLDEPGLYDFYLDVKSGDYELLVDNNPASVASSEQMVTLQLESGLHTFQIFTDFSGSGRDTSWSVGVVPASGGAAQPLSREAILSTGLLVVATLVFVDVSIRYLRRKRSNDKLTPSI